VDQLVAPSAEVEAEFVLDLLDLLIEVGDRFHDVGFATHEAG
jgi:hypothetical protein